jgi:hypothetical protein
MGTTPDQLDVIADLYGRGLLPFPSAIADLGAQQFHAGKPDDFQRFAAHFGKRVGEFPPAGPEFFTGKLFSEIGFRYTSFDVIEAPYARRLDLNTDTIPAELRGAFDLVLNFGTTEHVMNQFNAFKAMHDLCKPGGMIYGLFLRNGYDGHGLVRYTRRFLDLLIQANEYEIVWRSDHDVSYAMWRKRVGRKADDAEYFRDMCVWMVFRKTSEAPFHAIVDVE